MFGKDLRWEYHITVTTLDKDLNWVDIGERMNLGPVLTKEVMTGLANYMELLYDDIYYIEVKRWGAPDSAKYLATIDYDSSGSRWLDFSDFYCTTVADKRVLGLGYYHTIEI